MKVESFVKILGSDFYTGVPDSQLKALCKNKYWVLLQLNTVAAIIGNFSSGVAVYFTTYNMGSTTLSAVMMSLISISGMVGAFIIIPFIKKFDARDIVLWSNVVNLFVCIFMWFFAESSTTMLLVTFFIKNVFSGMSMGISGSLMGRVIDYGDWKFGERLDGISFAGQGLVQKAGNALGNAALGIILTAVGYVGGAGSISDSALFGIKVLYLGAPVVSCAIVVIIMIFFNLTKEKSDMMRREIDARNAKRMEAVG